MRSIPLEKEDEQNKSGVMFRISGAGQEKDGIHFSVDFISVSPLVDVGDTRYSIALRRAHVSAV